MIICLSLCTWHNSSPLPPIQSNNPLIMTAITQQDNLSWYSFLCGFPAKGWRNVQHEHPLLWMSKLQRRIWEIPWALWEHRNYHLHNDGSSIHRTDNQIIISEIIREWNVGIGDSPPRYQHTSSPERKYSPEAHVACKCVGC